MYKIIKTKSLFFLILIIISVSFLLPGFAFSFSLNPINFLQRTTNLVINRLSDVIHYFVLQKKYIFDDFFDPNIYPPFRTDLPVEIEEIVSSPIQKRAVDSQSKRLITVTTSTLPILDETTSKIPPKNIGQIIPVSPGIISDLDNNLNTKEDIEKIFDSDHISQILKFTNLERENASLPVFSASSILNKIANIRVEDLFENQYFDHNSPTGKSASEVAKQVSYDYLLIGENLALGNFDGDRGIVMAWMDSSGHRQNILNYKFTELGVAYKRDIYKGENTIIAVQIFGLPLTKCSKPNEKVKDIVDNSAFLISQMQAEALLMFNNLNTIKGSPNLDLSYYNQKIQEYNYMVNKINNAIAVMKNMIELYNIEVSAYNNCINNLINL